MHSLHVGGDVRSAQGSERDVMVFTPPRDDLGVAPRHLELANKLRTRNNHLPTKQAICVCLRIVCIVLLVLLAAFALYTTVSILVGRKAPLLCVKQAIPNGILKSAGNHAIPYVNCNEDYEVANPISPDIRCRLVMVHCSEVRRASLIHKEQQRCHRKFAFATEAVANASLVRMRDNGTLSTRADERQMVAVETAAMLNTTCIHKDEVTETRLYGAQSHRPLQLDSSKDGIASSLAALATLVMVPVMVLTVAERAPVCGRANGANEPGPDMVVPPDEAPLLSCNGAAVDGGDENA